MKNTLFIFFIAIASTTMPSYAKKFVVTNKMKIPTWIRFKMRPKSEMKHGKIIEGKEVDHTIMKEFKLKPGYSHIIKYTGEQHCLEKLYLRYHKGTNWWLLPQSSDSIFTASKEERVCSNREFVVKGKIDRPYFTSEPYPKKIKVTRMKAKTIHVGSSFQTIKDTIKKIVSSSLFKKEQHLFFKKNKPLTISLGTINLPSESEYNLGNDITLLGHESPINLEEKDKASTLAMLKDNQPFITLKPEKRDTFPLITIKENKKDNTLILANYIPHGIKRIETINVNQLSNYLERSTSVLTHDNYIFFGRFPIRMYVDLTIDEDGKRIVDNLRIHALYTHFWHKAYSPYRKPPRQDYRQTINRQTLLKNKILHTRYI